MVQQIFLNVAQCTDVGRKRQVNEDSMISIVPEDPQVMAKKGALFVVADGLGGRAAGDIASEMAVSAMSTTYYRNEDEGVAASLLQAVQRANALIYQRATENAVWNGMGTTCVAAVLQGGMAYIANVGDSRAYIARDGHIKQVSQDHSWVAEQVRVGSLTEEAARAHPQRNVIYRCLGEKADVEVDLFTEQVQEGDLLVLCTDGLSNQVSDEELREIVQRFGPRESVYHLIEQANQNGGPDNITAIVVRVSPGQRRELQTGPSTSYERAVMAQVKRMEEMGEK